MKISDLKNEKILVLGLSTTGFAAAKFLLRIGADCFLSDSKKYLEDSDEAKKAGVLKKYGAKLEFGGHSENFIKGAKFCILSPSIPPESEVLTLLDKLKIPYFSDIELAHILKPENTKIIAITGTNGKTTTTMLTSYILSKKFFAPFAGNVGISPLDYLCPENLKDNKELCAIQNMTDENSGKIPDFLVIEASSYQLHYTKNFSPEMAVFCNLTPDHINWHKSIENYFYDKEKMYERMDENRHAILNLNDDKVKNIKTNAKVHFFALEDKYEELLQTGNKAHSAYIKNNKIYYGEELIINTDDVPIVGAHNLQNVMCAIISAKISGLNNDTIKKEIMSFKAPKHRCELITTKNGTAYYNDSKATNPEASIVAIGAFEGKKVSLIAGGRDKNTSLDEFSKLVKERIDRVVLIGEAKERFNNALKNAGFDNIVFADTLSCAIQKAEDGNPDVVLFSPACASFDMFKNYEVRGDAFRDYVLSK